MEIIVLGAGAIGSLFAAKLAAQNNVTLVGRADHVRAINANGLRIEGLASQTIKIRAVEQIDSVAPDTLVLLTTKVTAASSADRVRSKTSTVSATRAS